jgi:branched-chain amino acid transport system ATP-binding protein
MITPLLQVLDLQKSFGGLRAVDALSFEVHAGEVLGLLGPNGSGKTTALNLIAGTLPPSGGSVRLDGRRIDGLAPHRIVHAGIARTFQLVRVLPGMTACENVAVPLAFRRDPSFGSAARGEAMARALALRPRLLLLDEWLAGLNPTELRQGIALVESLRAGGLTVVLVEHVMEAVRALCDRCVVMSAGARLADGPTASVLTDPAVVDVYLGRVHA